VLSGPHAAETRDPSEMLAADGIGREERRARWGRADQMWILVAVRVSTYESEGSGRIRRTGDSGGVEDAGAQGRVYVFGQPWAK
jgi:hypothetical protein